MALAGRSGIVGMLVLGGVLYYSGAGSWLWQRVEKLDTACYSGLADIGSSISNPVCGGLSKGIAALNRFGSEVERYVEEHGPAQWFGRSGEVLEDFGRRMQAGLAGLTSSSESLTARFNAGPRAGVSGGMAQQFQTAIDSFTIGQHLLDENGSTAQALPWLQQGAAQPHGMGLMSQISLANIYGSGSYGVPADSISAKRYLQQASDSLNTLLASEAPEARRMLAALPSDPRTLKQQIDTALKP